MNFERERTVSNDFSNSNLKWCFSSLGCPDLNLDETLALADRYGIGLIELRTLSGVVDIAPILEKYISEHPDKVADLKREGRIVGLNTSFHIAANTDADRDELIRTAKLADLFGARYLRVFGGFPFSEKLTPERLSESAKSLEWFDKIKRENGFECEITLEIHDGYSSSDRCAELMNHAGREVAILWDTHHSYRFANESFSYTWDKLSRQIKHVHVKDSLPVPGKPDKVEHKLPGQGDIPVRDLIALLKREHFSGPVSLEWERFWDKDIPPIEEALDAIIQANWL